MKKQYIIAGIIIVVLVAGGAFFLLTQKKSDSTVKQDTKSSTKPDTANKTDTASEPEEDLGACTMVTVVTIKSALGDAAKNLGNAQNTGVTSLGGGDKGQTCVYPFEAGTSVSNSFYVDIASYASQATYDDVTQYSSDGITVGVGDVAYFRVSEPMTSTSKEYSLSVQKDRKVILFVISQPGASATFSNDDAQAALTTIAKSAKL